MKNLKLSFLLVLLFLFNYGCDLFDDEEIPPGISIYKTNGDYFDLVTIGIKEGDIFRTDSYTQDSFKFYFTDDDTIFKYRLELINGYVLSGESSLEYDVFLDLSFKEHMLLEKACGRTTLPQDTLYEHILDNSYYTEFYRDDSDPRNFSHSIEEIDTAEINQIIKEGELEQYFTRFK